MPLSNEGSDETDDRTTAFDRRKFLGSLGVVGAAGVAGCFGGDEGDDGTPGDRDDDTPSDSDADGEPMDPEFTAALQYPPDDLQYNPWRPQNFPREPANVLWDVFAKYNMVDGFDPLIASDWDLPEELNEGDTVTVELYDGYTWHNGDDLTAQDVVNNFTILEALEMAVWDYLDSVTAVDDHTVEFTLGTVVLPDIFEYELFDRRIFANPEQFAEYAERLQDGEDRSAVQEDLVQFAPEEPIGNGPFMHGRTTDQKYIMELYEDYDNSYITADDINFPRYGSLYGDAGDRILQVIQGSLDGAHQVDPQPSQLEQFPEGHITTHPAFVGEAMLANTDPDIAAERNNYLDNRNVRKAIAHVVVRENLRLALPGPADLYDPVPIPTGFMPDRSEQILGPDGADVLDDFEVYAFEEPNHDRAAELLQGEGFYREDAWMTPDDEPWVLDVISTTDATWLSNAQAAVEDLSRFDIEVEHFQQEDTTYWGETAPGGDWDLAAGVWGGGGANIPYLNFGGTWSESTKRDFQVQETYEVPYPIGDPDGTVETVNPFDLRTELATAVDESRRTDLIAELAWIYNQSALSVPARVWLSISFVSTEEWEFPDPDEDSDMNYNRPAYWPLRKGKHRAKTQ